MAINQLLVRSYATNVFLTGNNTLDNIQATRPDYVQPVMEYAANKFYIDEIDSALANGRITPEQHANTLALKTPDDPQYRPITLMTEVGDTPQV